MEEGEYMKKCDHYFQDSEHCLKCGWKPKKCPKCNGLGISMEPSIMSVQPLCPVCNGVGYLKEDE